MEQDLFPESLDDLIQCPVSGQFLYEGVVSVVDADVFMIYCLCNPVWDVNGNILI
jgi:hypothetical protein